MFISVVVMLSFVNISPAIGLRRLGVLHQSRDQLGRSYPE